MIGVLWFWLAGIPPRSFPVVSPMSSSNRSANPILVPDRLSITVTFIVLGVAALSWFASYSLMPLMMGSSGGVAMIVSSLSMQSVGIFELVWVVGMVAMMFPAMIPVVVFYNKVATRLESNQFLAKVLGTPLFLLGYLATYAGLGLLAYVGVFDALAAASTLSVPSILALLAPSAILNLAGIYQLSPLKNHSLSQCISPLAFFAVHSKTGLFGSVRMGFRHSVYCVGCCWAYMLVMLAVAAMSLPFMAIIAAIITLEKAIIRGAVWFNRLVAFFFIALSIALVFFPNLLMLI